jgi:hypothetical protein
LREGGNLAFLHHPFLDQKRRHSFTVAAAAAVEAWAKLNRELLSSPTALLCSAGLLIELCSSAGRSMQEFEFCGPGIEFAAAIHSIP